jgi:hypothetical protein
MTTNTRLWEDWMEVAPASWKMSASSQEDTNVPPLYQPRPPVFLSCVCDPSSLWRLSCPQHFSWTWDIFPWDGVMQSETGLWVWGVDTQQWGFEFSIFLSLTLAVIWQMQNPVVLCWHWEFPTSALSPWTASVLGANGSFSQILGVKGREANGGLGAWDSDTSQMSPESINKHIPCFFTVMMLGDLLHCSSWPILTNKREVWCWIFCHLKFFYTAAPKPETPGPCKSFSKNPILWYTPKWHLKILKTSGLQNWQIWKAGSFIRK